VRSRRETLIKVDGKVFSLRMHSWYNKLNWQQMAAIR
jgi:hypothetical protein